MRSGSPSEVDGRVDFLNRYNDTMGTPLEAEPLEVGARLFASRDGTPGKSDAGDHECAESA